MSTLSIIGLIVIYFMIMLRYAAKFFIEVKYIETKDEAVQRLIEVIFWPINIYKWYKALK